MIANPPSPTGVWLPANLAIAALAGALAPLGWAPVGWWPLGVAAYATLYWLAGRTNARSAALIGLLFGLGLHAAGHGWIADTLYAKVGMNWSATLAGTTLFILYLAAFTAVPYTVWRALLPKLVQKKGLTGEAAPYMSALLFASLLTLGEWGRSLFFNGFTSLSLGYALLDTWITGYVPLGGVYLASWVGYYLSAVVAQLACNAAPRMRTLLPALALLGAGAALGHMDWVKPSGTALTFRLIQTDVAQAQKFDPLHKGAQKNLLLAAIEEDRADLIVTPETVLAQFFGDLPPETLMRLQAFSRRTDSHVFLGAVTLAADGRGYNSLLQFSPTENRIARYDKTRLTPFGEYSPAGFGWFTNAANIPLNDLSSGLPRQEPLFVKGQSIAALICHEDLAGSNMLRWKNSVGVVVNPGNLAWFEGSWHIPQRLQIARTRALESGRPVLRVTNTGVTAHIDHRGKVRNALPVGTAGVLAGSVQAMQGRTPYMAWGDWMIVLGCFGCVSAAAFVRARSWKRH